jgi:hypothetical protein
MQGELIHDSMQAEEEQRIARLMMQVGERIEGVEGNLRDLADALEPDLRTQGRFISKLCMQGCPSSHLPNLQRTSLSLP